MEIENKEQILQRRKEIGQELTDMLKETESDFTPTPISGARVSTSTFC